MSYIEELIRQVKKHDSVFIADTARVLGKVELAEDVSIWFGAVLRADLDSITIGKRSNVQESCTVHVDKGFPVVVGEDNVIGHGAIVHGCTIGNCNLIGMGATILTGAKIGNYCIIGAHALVTEKMIVPDGSMVLGTPGKIVKTMPVEDVKKMVLHGIGEYLEEAKKYK